MRSSVPRDAAIGEGDPSIVLQVEHTTELSNVVREETGSCAGVGGARGY